MWIKPFFWHRFKNILSKKSLHRSSIIDTGMSQIWGLGGIIEDCYASDMGDGWKAWKVTTVLWRQRKTLQSTLTTRFSADLINLCVTQFQGISLGGGVSQRCKQRKIKTSSER